VLCSDGDGLLLCHVAAGYHVALLSVCAANSAWGLLVYYCGGFLQGLCNCMRTFSCKTPCKFF